MYHLGTEEHRSSGGGAHRNTHSKANQMRAYLNSHPAAELDTLCRLFNCSRPKAVYIRRMWRAQHKATP